MRVWEGRCLSDPIPMIGGGPLETATAYAEIDSFLNGDRPKSIARHAV